LSNCTIEGPDDCFLAQNILTAPHSLCSTSDPANPGESADFGLRREPPPRTTCTVGARTATGKDSPSCGAACGAGQGFSAPSPHLARPASVASWLPCEPARSEPARLGSCSSPGAPRSIGARHDSSRAYGEPETGSGVSSRPAVACRCLAALRARGVRTLDARNLVRRARRAVYSIARREGRGRRVLRGHGGRKAPAAG